MHSPFCGPLPAAEFYQTLFSDTGAARPALRGTTQGTTPDGTRLASIWFRFEWELPNRAAGHPNWPGGCCPGRPATGSARSPPLSPA